MTTQSENIVTNINSNVFFKEFTFDKNNFYPEDGQKELADNVLWLDDLLFIIQVKERNPTEIKTKEDENKWFKNTVLKDAKNQIKETIKYFTNYNEIKIRNVRNHLIDVKQANINRSNKVIIYMPNSSLISDSNKAMKFYESKQVGNIHVFDVEDYYWISRYLLTPTELDEYLKFRERIYLKHKDIIKIYPEQYILSHFLNTDDESKIHEKYIESLAKFDKDMTDFGVSSLLNNFLERIHCEKQKQSMNYYLIIKEIAKLKRYELLEFKKRFENTIEDVKKDILIMPYRFTVQRTMCGFVFIPLMSDKVKYWENALSNFTEIYKYKRKLNKCLGVIVYKFGEYFDIQWTIMNYEWTHNKDLENAVNQESDLYIKSFIKPLERYRFNK